MDDPMNLKDIEKKTYMTYHGDGVWDLFLGLFFISIGVFMILDSPYLMGIIPAVMLPTVLGAKKSFVQPRLGYVKFSPERQAKENKGRTGMLVVFTLTFAFGFVAFYAFTGDSDWQIFFRNLGMIPFGSVLAVVLLAVGLFFSIRRFVIYGLLTLAIFIAGHFAHSDPPVFFIFIGIVVFIVGLTLFVRFIRKYPKSKEEMPYVN
jgi:hypothetical protein